LRDTDFHCFLTRALIRFTDFYVQIRHDFLRHTLPGYANDAWEKILSKSASKDKVVHADVVAKWVKAVCNLGKSQCESLLLHHFALFLSLLSVHRTIFNDFFPHLVLYLVKNHACLVEILFPPVKKPNVSDEERDLVLNAIDKELVAIAQDIFSSPQQPVDDTVCHLPPVPAAAVGLRFHVKLPTRKPVLPRPPSPSLGPPSPSPPPMSSYVEEKNADMTLDDSVPVPSSSSSSSTSSSSSSSSSSSVRSPSSHSSSPRVQIEEDQNDNVIEDSFCVEDWCEGWRVLDEDFPEERLQQSALEQTTSGDVDNPECENPPLFVQQEAHEPVESKPVDRHEQGGESSVSSPSIDVPTVSQSAEHSSKPPASSDAACVDISPATFAFDAENNCYTFELGPSKSSDLNRLDRDIAAGTWNILR
jgi:hypothetical protein